MASFLLSGLRAFSFVRQASATHQKPCTLQCTRSVKSNSTKPLIPRCAALSPRPNLQEARNPKPYTVPTRNSPTPDSQESLIRGGLSTSRCSWPRVKGSERARQGVLKRGWELERVEGEGLWFSWVASNPSTCAVELQRCRTSELPGMTPVPKQPAPHRCIASCSAWLKDPRPFRGGCPSC